MDSSSARLSLAVGALFCSIATAQQPGLEEVVVTAQRREENLQKAAIAVSAVSGNALTQAGVTEAADLTRLVPSIQIAPAAASFSQIYLRGVGTFGSNAFAEQGVAFNLDGIYLSRPAAPSALFYDLERIEVLKGPQGTLYGRNASGGALNVITAKPRVGESEGYLNAELGNYQARKASGAINLPAGEYSAFRVAGQYVDRDGYLSDGTDDEDTRALRAQFRFDPEGGVDITFSADYAQVGGKGSGSTIMPLLDRDDRLGSSDPRVIAEYLTRRPTPPVPQILPSADAHQDSSFYGAQATANVDLGFAMLSVIPAWRRTDLDSRSFTGGFLIDVLEDSTQRSLEARLADQTEQASWVLGTYYFDEDIDADQLYDQASNSTALQSDLSTRSYAAFGQLTYSLTDTFRLTGGLRYTSDNKEQNTQAVTRPFVGFVPPGPPAFIPIFLSLPSNPVSDADFEKVTWKAGIEYDVAPRSLLYASVATGFKSGILYASTGRNTSEPENLTAYTLGSKNRFWENRLQLNGEIFYWDYKDQQLSHLGPVQVATTPAGPIFGPVYLTENAGQATIYGAETELLWQVSENDLFTLNLQYLNTNYDELRYQAYTASGEAPVLGCPVTPTTQTGATPIARIYNVDCSGRSLVNAPEWAANAAFEHVFALGGRGQLTLGLDTRLESSRYLSIDFLPLGRQDAYTMSNARITYEPDSRKFALTAFVNNLEDETVFSNSTTSPVKNGTVYNQLRPPRTYGLRGSVRF
jgi:iron complex outermembrane recepter protein